MVGALRPASFNISPASGLPLSRILSSVSMLMSDAGLLACVEDTFSFARPVLGPARLVPSGTVHMASWTHGRMWASRIVAMSSLLHGVQNLDQFNILVQIDIPNLVEEGG